MTGAHKFENSQNQVQPGEFLEISEAQINSVRHLYAVGYSFGDAHVDRIVRRWLARMNERHLTIVDPARRDVPPTLRHLSPQIEIVNETAGTFFASWRASPLSRKQRLGRAFRDYTRTQRPGTRTLRKVAAVIQTALSAAASQARRKAEEMDVDEG